MMNKNYFPVNSLAPKGEDTTVFVKKVIGAKSDGFAVVDNGKIFVIDIGKADDVALIDYLLALREKWLDKKPVPNGVPARLELTLIVSHPHPDHIAALPLLLDDERFCVTEIYAPTRSRITLDPSKAPPSLVKYENRLEAACELLAPKGHTAGGITRVPFGSVYPVETGSSDTVLEIYRFPLAGIAAEIARNNPTIKIILMSPSDEQWHEWDLSRIGKTNQKRERLIKTAENRAVLYQDAFGLVTQENPQLREWDCRTLKISAHLKSILFSNVKLCRPPETK